MPVIQSSGVPYFGSLPLLSWIILCNPNLFKYFLAFSIFLITFSASFRGAQCQEANFFDAQCQGAYFWGESFKLSLFTNSRA
jgi:uncharacterized protein YjbI with pentapeptide repeats